MTWTLYMHLSLQICKIDCKFVFVKSRVVFTQLSPGGCQMSELSPVNYNHITGSHPGHWLLGYIIMCQVTSDHSAQKSPFPDLKFLNSPCSCEDVFGRVSSLWLRVSTGPGLHSSVLSQPRRTRRREKPFLALKGYDWTFMKVWLSFLPPSQ